MFPEGWRPFILNDCLDRIIDNRGRSIPKTKYGIPLITARNVREGLLDFSESEYIDAGAYDSWNTRGSPLPNDVLFTTEAPLGKAALFPTSGQYAIGQRVVVLRPRRNVVDPPFLMHYLLSPLGKRAIQLLSSGSTATGIRQSELRKLAIWIPHIGEQRMISATLSTWDRAIRQLTDLIAAKFQFKEGLMQQLLTAKRRFKGFSDEWETVHLKDVTEECEERNRGRLGTESVMAVTKAEGIIPMRERTIAADIDRYSVVKKDCFAYNPMRLNIGSIARWESDNDVLVSPDYVVFCCKGATEDSPAIDSDFLDQYRRSSLWERYVTSSGNGSVRVRIYFDDLGRMKLRLPSLEEQKRIATVLDTADRELEILRRELEALKTQKKGLMQKLLTGHVRLKI